MKVENPSSLVVQCFCYKTRTSQKKEEFSCRKYTNSDAQNATTIIYFIATAKINLGTKSISAANAGLNLHRIALSARLVQSLCRRTSGNIRPALSVVNRHFFIMTTIFTRITVAVVRNATTRCLCQSRMPSVLHPCPSFSAKLISSE